MKIKKIFLPNILLLVALFMSNWSFAQFWDDEQSNDIIVGAEQTKLYIPLLVGKKVGVVMNQTSLVNDQYLVDTLLSLKIKVKRIFTPEHGLRGNVDAGKEVRNGVDPHTNLPVISLYGEQKKPLPEHLADLDVIVFDLQDVGARFYTYISTMHYVMQACAENDKKVIVMDRPNPNGHYVDGPVLELSHKSFVGLHPIPIVHGMTVGELARMINEEGWLGDDIYSKKQCVLEVIPCKNYDHLRKYDLPVSPSPNLPNSQSIKLYPSLCLFEGTAISVGRGTHFPFQVYGHPSYTTMSFQFTPRSLPGHASKPKYMNQNCFGKDLRDVNEIGFTLKYLIDAYNAFPDKGKFFNPYFRKLIGNDQIQKWIEDGKSAELISKSWINEIKEFKEIRKKYLLYEDFE